MIVRRIARPLLSAIFISGGIAAIRYPQGHVEMAEPVLGQISGATGVEDKELLVKVNGAVMVLGGGLLALGRVPRIASLLLIGSLVPTTATHQFWSETDPQAKQMQQVQFFKNLGLLGGLLLAAVDTEGKPGVAYRAKMAGDSLGRASQTAKREARIAALQTKNAVG